jgi:carboxymethylenebutenolidase
VLVIHENRGLNDHIRDVARRLALAGFRAVAPDLLSPSGGTPANEDAARDAIGKLDLAKSCPTPSRCSTSWPIEPRRQGRRGRLLLGRRLRQPLAVAAGDKLDAGVAYYGPAPTRPKRPRSRRR